MNLELVFDGQMPFNAVHLATNADLVRVTLSERIDIATLLALHPEIRQAITRAMAGDQTSVGWSSGPA